MYLFGYPCIVLTSSGTSIWLILNPLSIAEALLRLSSPLYNAAWSELRDPIARELVTQALLLGAKVTGSGLPGSSWAPSRLALLASRACYTTQPGQSCEGAGNCTSRRFDESRLTSTYPGSPLDCWDASRPSRLSTTRLCQGSEVPSRGNWCEHCSRCCDEFRTTRIVLNPLSIAEALLAPRAHCTT